jgi:hypothetical protein
MKTKKVGPGCYMVTVNGKTFEIFKEEKNKWRVTCGEWGDADYWSDNVDTKKQAMAAINEFVKAVV